MIDLLELQKKTFDNTIRLGYTINKQTTIDKLIEELEEFRNAKPSINVLAIKQISNIEDPNDFCNAYEEYIKDREGCEISDIIKVLLSYSESIDQDSEMNLVLKNRYNDNRIAKS